MTEQTFIRKLSAVLSVLSPAQRDQLGHLLQDPVRRRAFQQLIQSTLKLSNGANNVRMSSESTTRGDAVASERYDEDSVRDSFASVLCDKKAFPTTNAVIDAIRYFFGLELDRHRFTKAGRREAIERAWRELAKLPSRERSQKLRRFFQEFSVLLDPHRSYRELFRILSRSE